jgi:hypothetical protein
MGENGVNPTHVVYEEFVCPDGYVCTKVPLNPIKFLDADDLKRRIAGPDSILYAHYQELIRDGAYANGVPIVYRTPRGNMFASDLRHSDVALYAEQNTAVRPGVPRNTVHPLISVKIIEVSSRNDIAVQRAIYLEKHR